MVLWNQTHQPLQWGVVIGASLVAAVTDLRSRRIANWLTGPLLLAGLIRSVIEAGWLGLADSAAGCGLLMLPFFLLFLFAGGGAGDAKLMAGIGAWLGVVNGLFALAGVLAMGGALAVALSLKRRKMTQVLRNIGSAVVRLIFFVLRRAPISEAEEVMPRATTTGLHVPYAVAIFTGVCVACLGVSIWRTTP